MAENKKEIEFNLSEKKKVSLSDRIFDFGREEFNEIELAIRVEDVKEFIRLLKEKLRTPFKVLPEELSEMYVGQNYNEYIIDKLAGNALKWLNLI